MTNVSVPAASAPLSTSASTANLGAETTTYAAGITLVVTRNNGNTLLHLHTTTSGTGTINALLPANNVSLTLTATGDLICGPFPTAIFGNTFTITTATAVGSVAAYALPAAPGVAVGSSPNGQHNPFESNVYAADY